MRRIILFSLPLLFVSGCGYAAPVTLDWTNPRFNATAGSCAISADSLKDLSRAEIYGRAPGQADSTLVATRVLTGREGLAESATFNQPEGTYTYWMYVFDLLGNKACRSNTASKTVTLVPGAPNDVR